MPFTNCIGESMKINPQVIFVNKKAFGEVITKHVFAAHPHADVVGIGFNTHSWNGKVTSLEPRDRYREKKNKLAVLKRDAKWSVDPNGRSSDFILGQMTVQGCGFFCTYCYTDRHYPNNYPKIYTDAMESVSHIRHVMEELPKYEALFRSMCNKKGFERERDSRHNPFVTFDLGCDSDSVLDNTITRHFGYCGHVIDIMNQCAQIQGAMTTFATKSAEIDDFISDCVNPSKHRIRLSLMPEWQRAILELNTSPIKERLYAINKLVDVGFEVHINLSPIVVTPTFQTDYEQLLKDVDSTLSDKAKKQLAYEIIFLTHASSMFGLIEPVLPKAHNMMVNGPYGLIPKWNKPNVLSYDMDVKRKLKQTIQDMIGRITPYGRVRYCF